MSQERRITIDRTTIDDLMPFFVGVSKELIAQDRVETDLQDFIDKLGTLQRDIVDFLNQLPEYLDKYEQLQEQKQAINRKIEAQKKEAAELEAKLKAEFGVGQQSSVFDTVDVLGMLSTPTEKINHDVQVSANALDSANDNDDDLFSNHGEGPEDALGGQLGAIDDAGRPIDPYMNLDDRLTDAMLKELQDTAVQRSDERAKAVAAKQAAAAKALSEANNQSQEDSQDDGFGFDDMSGNPAQSSMNSDSMNMDDMFGLDDDDDDLMGDSTPVTQQSNGPVTPTIPADVANLGLGDSLDDLDDDDF